MEKGRVRMDGEDYDDWTVGEVVFTAILWVLFVLTAFMLVSIIVYSAASAYMWDLLDAALLLLSLESILLTMLAKRFGWADALYEILLLAGLAGVAVSVLYSHFESFVTL